jgi:hypothetical protein
MSVSSVGRMATDRAGGGDVTVAAGGLTAGVPVDARSGAGAGGVGVGTAGGGVG